MDEEFVDRSCLRKGEYVDYFEVGHNFVAFYLDCGQLGQADEKTAVHSRIITSPIGAHRLSIILGKALQEYGRRFGPLRDESGADVKEAGTNEF
jgi:hypothetical protein